MDSWSPHQHRHRCCCKTQTKTACWRFSYSHCRCFSSKLKPALTTTTTTLHPLPHLTTSTARFQPFRCLAEVSSNRMKRTWLNWISSLTHRPPSDKSIICIHWVVVCWPTCRIRATRTVPRLVSAIRSWASIQGWLLRISEGRFRRIRRGRKRSWTGWVGWQTRRLWTWRLARRSSMAIRSISCLPCWSRSSDSIC